MSFSLFRFTLSLITFIFCFDLFSLNSAHSQHVEKATANRLINASSPYLRQHAYNPVDWYPWGEEAFDKARRENKPIILSIGYSTCYWCHVMEREIFSKPKIAEVMNQHFVSIKVDREQRPDVDDIYMKATQIMTGSGGWPNNLFLTPDLKPFFAGTYFPPESTRGRPGWPDVLQGIAQSWNNDDRERIQQAANRASNTLVTYLSSSHKPFNAVLDDDNIPARLLGHYRTFHDSREGGFYQAPKFPQETALLFLLDMKHDDRAQSIAQHSLAKMFAGGIHDHVGGGFHRYSTDSFWRIPHFEKMLYNQALLARAYARLYSNSKAPFARDAVEDILGFVDRVMTSPEGAFYSALDAETDAVEGAYYTWTEDQLTSVLGEDRYQRLDSNFDFAEPPRIAGHLHNEGRVMYLPDTVQEMAENKDVSEQAVLDELAELTTPLLPERAKRKRPLLDTKIITAWNGLMIDAYARASIALEKPEYAKRAARAADFILEHDRGEDGALYRITMDGKPHLAGTLEDYAYFAQGLISTYRATGDRQYLDAAKETIATADRLLGDADGRAGYYFSVAAPDLLVRIRGAQDSAIPAANAVMTHVFLDLHDITEQDFWREKAASVLAVFGKELRKWSPSYAHLTHALWRYQNPEDLSVASAGIGGTVMVPALAENGGNGASETAFVPDGQQQSKDKVNVKVALEPENPVAGAPFKVRVTLEVEDGWHVNSHTPPLEYLIPTSVDVRSEHPLKVVHERYPEPAMLQTPLMKEPLPIYEGITEIVLTAVIRDWFEESITVIVPVRVQACKDDLCLTPSDMALTLDVQPTDAEAPETDEHSIEHHGC